MIDNNLDSIKKKLLIDFFGDDSIDFDKLWNSYVALAADPDLFDFTMVLVQRELIK